MMFTKQSRYYSLPAVVTQDKTGQARQSKSLRLLPEVTGDFQHIIEANDRLDHLAFKYYQRPRQWWRISDANPEFLSPLALLGKEPVSIVRFRLVWDDEDGPPPWAAVRQEIRNQPGVYDVQVEDEVQLRFSTLTVEEETISTATSTPDRAILVTHNTLLVDPFSLMDTFLAHGFQQVQAAERTRVGKPITIPPANARSR
jgi:hypothetical protein